MSEYAMSGAHPSAMPEERSLQQLVNLQNTTRETVGVLIDRLRPVLIQHPEKPLEDVDAPGMSAMADLVNQEKRILAMLNGILRDLDL